MVVVVVAAARLRSCQGPIYCEPLAVIVAFIGSLVCIFPTAVLLDPNSLFDSFLGFIASTPLPCGSQALTSGLKILKPT